MSAREACTDLRAGGVRRIVIYLALAALAGVRPSAGLCSPAARSGQSRNEFEISAGYSPASSTLIGSAENRKFVMAGFTYAYRCWDQKNVSISYAAGVMPAAIVVQPRQFMLLNPGPSAFQQGPTTSQSVYGFGVTPVGIVFEFGARRHVHPLAEAAGGIVASTEPIPISAINATGLNFLFYFGGGVRFQVHERDAVTLGYRFLHISNAGTTNFNPGLDNNVFYIGYSFRR